MDTVSNISRQGTTLPSAIELECDNDDATLAVHQQSNITLDEFDDQAQQDSRRRVEDYAMRIQRCASAAHSGLLPYCQKLMLCRSIIRGTVDWMTSLLPLRLLKSAITICNGILCQLRM